MFPKTKYSLIKKIINFSQNHISQYASERNYDLGIPHKNVSKLSPYLRRRFITEEEILKIITKYNDIKKIEKFIEEIFWRTYWRGWLETHPWVFNHYQNINEKKNLPKKTGIKCFDHWKEELLDTGYLHNHSRMWFASIWIFTLGYSWESGAKFFEENLLDYCPASNTLGWRWVAGLQTINKPYIAKADNIKFFTNNRFNPKNQLKENIVLNYDSSINGIPLSFQKTNNSIFKNKDKIGIILNNNDLSLYEILDNKNLSYDCCLYVKKNQNNVINNFQNQIYNDICNRKKNITITKNYDEIYVWLKEKKIRNCILPYETIGNKIFSNNIFLKTIESYGVKINFYLRDWDNNAFPYALRGFFKFKEKIAELMNIADI